MDPNEQNQDTNEQQVPAGDQGEQSESQAFTQADVDRIIKERLERERTRTADYEDLKKAAQRLKEIEAAQLTETQRLEKERDEAKQAAAAAETAAQAREAEINQRLIRAEVRVVAAELGFANPEDAYHLADLAGVEVDENGAVQNVKKALEKLAKEKLYLLKTENRAPGTPPRSGGRSTGQQTGSAEAAPRPTVRW